MTDEQIKQVKDFTEKLRNIARIPGIFNSPAEMVFFEIRKDIPEGLHFDDYPVQAHIIAVANQALFIKYPDGHPWLNPIAMGQIIASLDSVIAEEMIPSSWNCVHPRIKEVSIKLFLDGHFTNVAQDAFVEINDAIKEVYRVKRPGVKPPDDVDLMHKTFGKNDITLADIQTENGRNVQEGFHYMFSGAISAFRNPKAHSDHETLTVQEALRKIMFASTLMYKLDDKA